MSYILDALKKAERERGISRMPTLATIHELRKARWHYLWIIAGAIVLSIVALVWFFLVSPKRATQPQTLAQIDTGSNDSVAPPSTNADESSNAVKATLPASENAETKRIVPSTPANVPSAKPGLPAYEAVTRKSVANEPGTGAAAKAAAFSQENDQDSSEFEEFFPEEQSDTDDAAMSAPVIEQGHLETNPASFREAADKMTLNIHVYSEVREERLVFINGKKYHEGDYVDGKYLLEEITPEGAVLSHQGAKAILRPGRK
jgi:general secretion pathway protein B